MRLILAKLLWSFDMALCPQNHRWEDQMSFILWEKSPLLVKMRVSSKQ